MQYAGVGLVFDETLDSVATGMQLASTTWRHLGPSHVALLSRLATQQLAKNWLLLFRMTAGVNVVSDEGSGAAVCAGG